MQVRLVCFSFLRKVGTDICAHWLLETSLTSCFQSQCLRWAEKVCLARPTASRRGASRCRHERAGWGPRQHSIQAQLEGSHGRRWSRRLKVVSGGQGRFSLGSNISTNLWSCDQEVTSFWVQSIGFTPVPPMQAGCPHLASGDRWQRAQVTDSLGRSAGEHRSCRVQGSS